MSGQKSPVGSENFDLDEIKIGFFASNLLDECGKATPKFTVVSIKVFA
jgi:hypothetical protein